MTASPAPRVARPSYRAAIVGRTGAGNYGHGLDLVWRNVDHVQAVAVADPDDAGLRAAVDRSGAARGYADYREMLEREQPDLLSVAARWPDEHEAVITAAVGAGVRGIYCEKPLARTPAEADRIMKLSERAGTKIAVALHHRAIAVVHELRRVVERGEIGEVREIRGRPTIGPRGGAFLFAALGTHIVDLMRYLLRANPEWAFGRVTDRAGRECAASDAQPAAEAYGLLAGDAVTATYGFPNGVTATCDSYFAPDVLEGTMTLEVWGTHGIAAMRQGPGLAGAGQRRLYRWDASSGRAVQDMVHVPTAGWDDDPRASESKVLNAILIRDLIAAVEEDRQPLASGADAQWALDMIFAAHESHLVGSRVKLPSAQRDNPYEARLPRPPSGSVAAGTGRS